MKVLCLSTYGVVGRGSNMVEIEVECPYCGQWVYVERRFDTEVKCPECGRWFDLKEVIVWS